MKRKLIVTVFVSVICMIYACNLNQKKAALNSEKKSNLIQVKGKAVYTTRWCGGARPTPQMEAEHAKARAVRHTSLIFTNIATGKKIICKTDEQGNFKFSATAGKWEYRFDRDFYSANKDKAGGSIPKECDKFYNKAYGTISCNSDTSELVVKFKLECNPCRNERYPRP